MPNELIEKYGNPRLIWGYYPISEDYNLGGCVGGEGCEPGCGVLYPADPVQVARAKERKLGMEQRGGNNPLVIQDQPAYTKHVVGTGCYNPNCHCFNCHGDCLCDKAGGILADSGRGPVHTMHGNGIMGYMPSGTDNAMTWIGMVVLALFVYKFFIKRR